MQNNKIIILSGLSNCGKDSILTELVKKYGFRSLISHTTRAKRPSEIEGREYFFISKEDFFEKDESGKFIETRHYFTRVNGKRDIFYYGLSKAQIENRDKPCVVILDKQGCEEFAEYIGAENVVLVYLEVDKEIARQRNIKRADYDETEFERRWKSDSKSFKGIEDLAHSSINTDRELKDIIEDVLNTYNYYN
jgi:guanylate kinase